MLRMQSGSALLKVVIPLVLAVVALSTARAETADEISALNSRAGQLYTEGKYAEALPLAEQALIQAKSALGPDHPETLASVKRLADIYQAQNRLEEAEPLFKHALAGRERVLGIEHIDTVTSLEDLAAFYESQRRHAETEPLYRRALQIRERTLGKEAPQTLDSADSLASLYETQGRYAEAEPLYRRVLEARERLLGDNDEATHLSRSNLASLLHRQGRYGDAEALYQKALHGYERKLGKDDVNTLAILSNLAGLYLEQGRYAEAEPLYRRAREGCERTLGAEHSSTLTVLNNLGLLYDRQGRYVEAEPVLKQTLDARERVLGKEHPDTLQSVGVLASVYYHQARFDEAEALFKRALEASERVRGKGHRETISVVTNLALLYYAQARLGEAEPLFRRALEGQERVLGTEHPITLLGVNNLAQLYSAQGRFSEAEPLFRRAAETSLDVLGKKHPTTLLAISNLGTFLHAQGHYDEVEPLVKLALELSEVVLGKEHPETLVRANNLASVYQAQHRHGEAEPILKHILDVGQRVIGENHPLVLNYANNLAALYEEQGRYAEAEPLLLQVVESRLRVQGEDHLETIGSISNLGYFYFARHDWARATPLLRRSADGLIKRTLLGAQETGATILGKKKSDAARSQDDFVSLVKATYRLAIAGHQPAAESMREMFETAQWALGSDTGQSLTHMAARGAKGDQELAVLIRERQDLIGEWQRRDVLRNGWLSQATDQRNADAEAENSMRLATIDTRVATIDERLTAAFPEYNALVSPKPLSVEAAQVQLRDDEALVLFLDTPEYKQVPEETLVWVLTKTDVRWVRSELGTAALTRLVQALRCGLDREEWGRATDSAHCAELLGLSETQDQSQPLPFDLGKAHSLYKALFGQVEEVIKGKNLLIVPSGPLTQLPFHVLVTAPAAAGNFRPAAWLVREYAIAVLPAVSSLTALRRIGRPSGARKPMIGFGNPLLDGPDARYMRMAQRARDNQHCRDSVSPGVTAFLGLRGVAPLSISSGLADVASVRGLVPLPETADELCTVAADLKADPGELRLGARATEHEIKTLSDSGRLADYHIVHFATHGAMAGQLDGATEPGLVLTPPAEASSDDDGYLSASEIAGLRLDADWVILSACNTAAGDADSAQALSGLARAFFYAQARALLVSHWAVYSNATVNLITGAMREMNRDRNIGRAEALRRSMVALIDGSSIEEVHPSYWAPFIVVGEGGR